jgi:hypothetical protein
LITFQDYASGFSTSDLRDADDEIVQVNTGSELIWTADGTRLLGSYIASHSISGVRLYWISGKICAEECAFEVRFGTRDGEQRACLTVDYGHDNPGTVVDVEVAGGALSVTQTNMFPPGTPTLSGVVSELTPLGRAPVEGVRVGIGISSGGRSATTDTQGFYSIPGLFNVNARLYVSGEGYQPYNTSISIDGDTAFDVELVRP